MLNCCSDKQVQRIIEIYLNKNYYKLIYGKSADPIICHHPLPVRTPQVEFSSHRGSSLHAPENTTTSVALAWEQGADALEIDIHLSKDNKLMVIHDSNTKRTSGKKYRVDETISINHTVLSRIQKPSALQG